MKARILTAVALVSLVGTAWADNDPHGAYNRAFLGKTDAKVSAASSPTTWRESRGEGHAAYNRAFLGASGQMQPMGSMGRSGEYAGSGSGMEGHRAYHRIFVSD